MTDTEDRIRSSSTDFWCVGLRWSLADRTPDMYSYDWNKKYHGQLELKERWHYHIQDIETWDPAYVCVSYLRDESVRLHGNWLVSVISIIPSDEESGCTSTYVQHIFHFHAIQSNPILSRDLISLLSCKWKALYSGLLSSIALECALVLHYIAVCEEGSVLLIIIIIAPRWGLVDALWVDSGHIQITQDSHKAPLSLH